VRLTRREEMFDSDWRQLSDNESQILAELLAINFLGKDALVHQVKSAVVQQLDDNGSLKFRILDPILASVPSRVPVEGECEDADGIKIHFLLHVVDGVIDELEVFREDSGRILLSKRTTKLRVY
jgi:hypothetical protein